MVLAEFNWLNRKKLKKKTIRKYKIITGERRRNKVENTWHRVNTFPVGNSLCSSWKGLMGFPKNCSSGVWFYIDYLAIFYLMETFVGA